VGLAVEKNLALVAGSWKLRRSVSSSNLACWIYVCSARLTPAFSAELLAAEERHRKIIATTID
jgi:hypothetical protein